MSPHVADMFGTHDHFKGRLTSRLEKTFLDQVPIFQNSAAAPAPGGCACDWPLRLRLASGPAANIKGFFDILALYTIEIN